MITDAFLIRRLAHEIAAELSGAKVRDAGLLADGRVAIVLWKAGVSRSLCIGAFGAPPSLTIEPEEPEIGVEPGFVRALAVSLRGTTLLEVRALRGDRVVRLTFGARSRFGVAGRLDLIVELIPRFGNAALVKGETIVAALKEFSPAQNPSRPIAAGQPYRRPPARSGDALPKAVARGRTPAECRDALAFLESDAAMDVEVYVYRRDGRIVQAHLLPLDGFAGAAVSRSRSLIEVLAEVARTQTHAGAETGSKRREALDRLLAKREDRLRSELRSLADRRLVAVSRDEMRLQGEAIYGTLHEIASPAARDEAKDRAAKLFARYKKLGASLPHLDARQKYLEAEIEAVETLLWEASRASGPQLDDVEREAAALTSRPGNRSKASVFAPKRKRRAILEMRAPDGSRVLVGRSPVENAELTFRVAKPNDLWFHARGTPGAHVILSRDDRSAPSARDVAFAASLAAWHSKARGSGKVDVDYTERKHVRKRPDAPPGLVWYVNAKTVAVSPAERGGA